MITERRGRDESPIGREGHGQHDFSMPDEQGGLPLALHVPEPHGLVLATGDEGPAIQGKRQRGDRTAMTFQGGLQPAGDDVPEVDSRIGTAHRQRGTVGRKDHPKDDLLARAQGEMRLVGGQAPQRDRSVHVAGGQDAPSGDTESDRVPQG